MYPLDIAIVICFFVLFYCKSIHCIFVASITINILYCTVSSVVDLLLHQVELFIYLDTITVE